MAEVFEQKQHADTEAIAHAIYVKVKAMAGPPSRRDKYSGSLFDHGVIEQ